MLEDVGVVAGVEGVAVAEHGKTFCKDGIFRHWAPLAKPRTPAGRFARDQTWKKVPSSGR
ncbi:hypothetical protein GCM10007350_05190 [Jeongeupia chitinilytica]|uniref:Uncharacterized protein n=1 Tax=Jeongeupia chitinilytica TaxID=1041641 RepID=A0ABQ3GXE7_9NEIS|nr:hypothetical protein GCM10007350_05190 [Jeongeupia chitinilytica]